MAFGEVFSKSLKEYRQNFKPILKLMIIFLGIPMLIITIISAVWVLSNDSLRDLNLNPMKYTGAENLSVFLANLDFFVVSIIFSLVSLLLLVFVQAGLISSCINNSKFSYRELLNNSRKNFGKFFLFVIVLVIFLFGLTILLIVPGIIFAIYWAFGAYVLFDENRSIRASLRRSREIVKGRWWLLLGNILLIALIAFGVSMILSLFKFPFSFLFIFSIIAGSGISPVFYFIDRIITMIIEFAINLIILPFSILFLKNLYFEFKKTGKAGR